MILSFKRDNLSLTCTAKIKKNQNSPCVESTNLRHCLGAFSWGCWGTMGKTGSQILDQRETSHQGWALLFHWEETQANGCKN